MVIEDPSELVLAAMTDTSFVYRVRLGNKKKDESYKGRRDICVPPDLLKPTWTADLKSGKARG